MNERLTVLFALASAEVGGALALLLGSTREMRGAGFTSGPELLLPHAATMAVYWACVAGVSRMLSPKLWRYRQGMDTKLRLLGWVCGLWLLVDSIVTAYLYRTSLAVDGAGPPPVELLLLAMALRSVGGLGCFWLAVWAHVEVERRRVVQVTPPPKFGKE